MLSGDYGRILDVGNELRGWSAIYRLDNEFMGGIDHAWQAEGVPASQTNH